MADGPDGRDACDCNRDFCVSDRVEGHKDEAYTEPGHEPTLIDDVRKEEKAGEPGAEAVPAKDGAFVASELTPGPVDACQAVNKAGDDQSTVVYCCKKCRCELFSEKQLADQHKQLSHTFSHRRMKKEASSKPRKCGIIDSEAKGDVDVNERLQSADVCTSLFLSEPNLWMHDAASDSLGQPTGKILCPSCDTRVGAFAWPGLQCSCGTWIVPAFQFPCSKLDARKRLETMLPAHIDAVNENQFSLAVANDAGEDISEFAAGKAEVDTDCLNRKQLEARLKEEHRLWFEQTHRGDQNHWHNTLFQRSSTDEEECSLTTFKRKQYEGVEQVADVLKASSGRLSGRLALKSGPIVLPFPSTSTRIMFSVDGLNCIMGETIVWNATEMKAHHIIRTKDPSKNVFMNP